MSCSAVGSIADSLAAVASDVPFVLASPAALGRARTVAAALPAALTNRIYLECRGHADGAHRVDLSVSVARRERSILLGERAALDASVACAAGWRGVRALAARWGDPTSSIHQAIQRIWLEFDIDPGARWREAVAQPGVFIDFAPTACAHPSPAVRLTTARDALGALGGVTAGVLAALGRCVGALPPSARLLYVGAFPGRPGGPVRACVAGLARGEIMAYLAAVGWPGSTAALEALLELLAAHPDTAGRVASVLHPDLHPDGSAGARIGMERAFARGGQLRGRIDDARLLDALVAVGLCSAAKRRAMECWPGCAVRTMPHELWPSVVARRVNHIKLVGGDDADPEAKIYLCATHRYLDRRQVRARAIDAGRWPAGQPSASIE